MKSKPIFNSYMAKLLLKRGNAIIDIQPDKYRVNAIIFYFEETEKFMNDLNELSAQLNDRR